MRQDSPTTDLTQLSRSTGSVILVRFGHDGWFGRLAREITFESVEAVARVAGALMVRDQTPGAHLIIGFDRRFLSNVLASMIARVLATEGIPIWLASGATPAPALAYGIQQVGAAGAIMVTGANFPADVNGLRLFGRDGGALPRWLLDQIQTFVGEQAPIRRIGPTADVVSLDPVGDYLASIGDHVSLRLIKRSGITVAVDPMWGTASELLPRITDGDGARSVEIRTAHNPLFPEVSAPNPVQENLARLRRIVQSGEAAIGAAMSGDGRLLGIMDENGVPVQTGTILDLIAYALLNVQRESGALARTIAASTGVDRIADEHGIALHETPYGHTTACASLRDLNPILYGDDEGGIILVDHVLEPDAILATMLIVDCVVRTGAQVSELVADVQSITGKRSLERLRIELTPDQVDRVQQRLAANDWPAAIEGRPVHEVYATDGVKLELESDCWLLIRFDVHDNVLHLAAESPDPHLPRSLLEAGRHLALA